VSIRLGSDQFASGGGVESAAEVEGGAGVARRLLLVKLVSGARVEGGADVGGGGARAGVGAARNARVGSSVRVRNVVAARGSSRLNQKHIAKTGSSLRQAKGVEGTTINRELPRHA